MRHMHTLQGLVLDVDGTLADTEEFHRRAFNQAFADFGLDWHWSRAHYVDLLSISGGLERMRAYAQGLGSAMRPVRDLAHFCRDLHRHKTALYRSMLASGGPQLRPGVRRLIDEARAAGLRLGLATSTARGNVRQLLDPLLPAGWEGWFEAIVTCDEVAEKKPSDAAYREALRLMGLPARHCVAVEDTVNGLRAALAAGLRTIVTTHYFTEMQAFPGASLVVDQLGEPEAGCRVTSSRVGPVRWVDLNVLRRALEAPTLTRYRFHSPAAYASAVG